MNPQASFEPCHGELGGCRHPPTACLGRMLHLRAVSRQEVGACRDGSECAVVARLRQVVILVMSTGRFVSGHSRTIVPCTESSRTICLHRTRCTLCQNAHRLAVPATKPSSSVGTPAYSQSSAPHFVPHMCLNSMEHHV